MVVVSLARWRRGLLLVCVLGLLAAVIRWGMLQAPVDSPVQQGAPITRLSVQERAVALTFDGPGTDLDALATSLRAENLPATVFVSGAFALERGQVVRDLAQAGLEVEAAGWDGTDLTTRSPADIEASLHRTVASIAAETRSPTLFLRPPDGRYNRALVRTAEKAGLGVVTWTSAVDGAQPGVVAQRVLANLVPGAIIRLPVTPATVGAVPQIAVGLRMRGYEAITLEALLAMAEGAADVSLRTVP